ncbi:restriction endonuclease subunit S [Fusobacterium sp. PH5-44]|uniref:restriction endonuclease subunit S n=1 Tax=unclassified Fusobacterium TaxID=2648384 RepID=UPI003D232D86
MSKWKHYRLEEGFISIKNGATIKQTSDKNEGLPITRIETIYNGEVNRDRMGYAGIMNEGKYSENILNSGDILMSHINSQNHLGKTALYVSENDEKIIHGMNLLRLQVDKKKLESEFVNYYFKSLHFKRQLLNITKNSVNQSSFTITGLKELLIPIPKIDVQRKISKKLKKLNDIIALKKEQLKKLDEFVKSLFIEMFSQKNTEVKLSYYIESLTAGKSLAGEEVNKNKVLKTGSVSYDCFD